MAGFTFVADVFFVCSTAEPETPGDETMRSTETSLASGDEEQARKRSDKGKRRDAKGKGKPKKAWSSSG